MHTFFVCIEASTVLVPPCIPDAFLSLDCIGFRRFNHRSTLNEDGMALKLLGLPLTYTTDLQVAQLIDFFAQNGQPPGWDKDDFIEFLQHWNADVGPVIRICDLTQDVTESQAFFELLNPQTQQTLW